MSLPARSKPTEWLSLNTLRIYPNTHVPIATIEERRISNNSLINHSFAGFLSPHTPYVLRPAKYPSHYEKNSVLPLFFYRTFCCIAFQQNEGKRGDGMRGDAAKTH